MDIRGWEDHIHTKQERIDMVLKRHPEMKDHWHLEQTALGGTVQIGPDQYMDFGDWEIFNQHRKGSHQS